MWILYWVSPTLLRVPAKAKLIKRFVTELRQKLNIEGSHTRSQLQLLALDINMHILGSRVHDLGLLGLALSNAAAVGASIHACAYYVTHLSTRLGSWLRIC